MNYIANYISVGNQEFGRTGPFQFVPTDFDMKAADFLIEIYYLMPIVAYLHCLSISTARVLFLKQSKIFRETVMKLQYQDH